MLAAILVAIDHGFHVIVPSDSAYNCDSKTHQTAAIDRLGHRFSVRLELANAEEFP